MRLTKAVAPELVISGAPKHEDLASRKRELTSRAGCVETAVVSQAFTGI